MTALRVLVRALIRTAVLTALLLLYLHGANVGWWGFADDGGLATGLLGFTGVLVLSGLWGLVDGVRRGLGAAIDWVVVAVLAGLAMTIGTDLVNGVRGADLTGDLLEIAPVLGGIVLAGGAVGACIGGAVRTLTRRDRRPVSV